MAVLKIKKQSHFATFELRLVQGNHILFKAKGFLVYLLSLPDNWEVNVNYHYKEFSEGKTFFYSCIRELKEAGYITHIRHRNENGQVIKGEYIVRESAETLHSDNRNEARQVPQTLQSGFLNEGNLKHENLSLENLNELNIYKDKKEIIHKKETAAIKADDEFNDPDDDLLAAAPLEIIHNGKLNTAQVKPVKEIALELFPTSKCERRVEALIAVLEDGKAFTKSGNLFYKKINTIKKRIQLSQWRSQVVTSTPDSSTQKIFISASYAPNY